MRDFCERERLRDGKYLGAGDRERVGGHWLGDGEREMWLAPGKERQERAMMRENFLVRCPALI
jgi:hypothetical protein